MISETYASPGLRLALFLLDNPGAPQPTFAEKPAAEVDVPATWLVDSSTPNNSRGNVESFVVATLTPNVGPTVEGLKEVPAREKEGGSWGELVRSPETFDKLCTKALGRALKRAGYPGDIVELRAIMAWRRRQAEIAALDAGRPLPVAEPTAAEAELERAGQASEDHDPDETNGEPARDVTQAGQDEASRKPLTPIEAGGMIFPPGDLGRRVVALDGASQAKVSAYLSERNLDPRTLPKLKVKALSAYVASLERDMRRAGAQTAPPDKTKAAAPTTRPEPSAAASDGPEPVSGASEASLPLDSGAAFAEPAKPTDETCSYCTGEIDQGDSVVRTADGVYHAMAEDDGATCFASYEAEKAAAPANV